MIVMIDVQEQFWNYFQQFKKEYSSLVQVGPQGRPLILDLIIVGNKLIRIENKSQLNKVRPADNFPNANFALPLYHLLPSHKPSNKTNSKNVIISTGNLFSPINFIDVNILKQNLLKANIKVHCNYLGATSSPPLEEEEFLRDLACFTEGKFFVNESIKTIIESGAIQ